MAPEHNRQAAKTNRAWTLGRRLIVIELILIGAFIGWAILTVFVRMGIAGEQVTMSLGIAALMFGAIALALVQMRLTPFRRMLRSAVAAGAVLVATWLSLVWAGTYGTIWFALQLWIALPCAAWVFTVLFTSILLTRRVRMRALARLRTFVVWMVGAHAMTLAAGLSTTIAFDSAFSQPLREVEHWMYRIHGSWGMMTIYFLIVTLACMWMERGLGGVAPQRARVGVRVTCPRCDREQAIQSHGDNCGRCGLRITVTPI